MYYLVRYYPSGDGKYWDGSRWDSYLGNAVALTRSDAEYLISEFVEQGFAWDDFEIINR